MKQEQYKDSVPEVAEWRIDEWVFQVAQSRLEFGPDSVELEPQAAQLLNYLVARAGLSVSRETLLDEAWPEAVGGEVLDRSIDSLRKAFEDDPQNPQVIEVTSNGDCRLIAMVEPMTSILRRGEADSTAESLDEEEKSILSPMLMAVITILVCLVIAAIAFAD